MMKAKRAGQLLLTGLAFALAAAGCISPSKDNGAPMGVTSSSINAQVSAGGLAGFKSTVYQYAITNCVSCHGSTQNPKFAQSDVNAAYNVAVSFPIVNFSSIASSIIIQKVSDGHCGSACSGTNNAQVMTSLIEQWQVAMLAAGATGGGAASTTATVYTNALPIPAPNTTACASLPGDLQCSPDLKSDATDSQGHTLCANRCWTKLRYPVAKMSVLPGVPSDQNPTKDPTLQRAWLEVDFAYENYASQNGVAAYVLKNPRLMSPDGPAYVHDLGIYINGVYKASYGQAYHDIDLVVDKANFAVTDGAGHPTCNIPPAPTPVNFATIDATSTSYCVPSVAPLFSTAASASDLFQERTSLTRPDMISFSFGYLKSGILGNCKEPNMWLNQVYKPIVRGSVACLDCHKPAGAVTEAGQRFDMYAANYVTNATQSNAAAATAFMALNYSDLDATTRSQLDVVCQRFLQRTNLKNPQSSPIIVQPIQGLNGMPPQANFNLYDSDLWWLGWIKQEATDLGISYTN